MDRGRPLTWKQPPVQPLMLALAGSALIGSAARALESVQPGGSAVAPTPLNAPASAVFPFTDVRPTDWAHQALFNLLELHGCPGGDPDHRFRADRTLSRFEAAALLQACLDHGTAPTDALRRLIAEFATELTVVNNRIDALNRRVDRVETLRFSPTTRLTGLATFVVGGVSPHPAGDKVTFNNDLQLNIDTSFSGNDRLRTILRAGNFDLVRNAFNRGLSTLETAFQLDEGPNLLGIDRIYYQFPLGHGFTATLGARVGQEDMLALWPSVYPASTVLNLLNLAGAPLANNQNLGPGFGLWWQAGGWSVSANLVAAEGAGSSKGLFSSDSATTGTVQLGYGKESWGVAATYSHLGSGVGVPGATPFVTRQIADEGARTNAFGISGFWQPARSGLLPSISVGYGRNHSQGSDLRISQSWMAGLQWSDVLAKGNSFGMGFGQPAFASATRNGAATERDVWAWEWWYRWQLSDQISLTPAIFILHNPSGGTSDRHQYGALLKTGFSF